MTKKIQVDCLVYQKATVSLKKEFLRLINDVWPRNIYNSRTPNLDLSPVVFFVRLEKHVVSYCVVLFKEIFHFGNTYKAAGLSYVCTQTEYRNQGYGSQIVKTATQFIENSNVDIGLFSCDTELIGFYEQHGWLLAPDVSILLGGLSSIACHKAVMLQFFSLKALKDRVLFQSTVINLCLPRGECW
ncbi:MAG: GNAT family N-acetyltransferase [Candidatus Rhabdochlamydia sp.]